MGFQEALANACAPISIKIDIDPAGMVPGSQIPFGSGGSIVDRDHKYCPEPDPIAKMMQEIMCKTGICPPEACDPGMKDAPKSPNKPEFNKDTGSADSNDDEESFGKNKFKK